MAAAVSCAVAGGLDKLIDRYASAPMVDLDVRIVSTSEIFGGVDTLLADITIADDGRYAAYIGGDAYVFDGNCIYEYSAENNQAVKDCLGEGEIFENDLFFIKDLKKYYKIADERDDSLYLLIRLNHKKDQLPDTLHVAMEKSRLNRIEYFDLNHDLNQVYFMSDTVYDAVDAKKFEVDFPDSTEIISMP